MVVGQRGRQLFQHTALQKQHTLKLEAPKEGLIDMGASINRGPQNRPKYLMVLMGRTTKMGPLICGNGHILGSTKAVVVFLGQESHPGLVDSSCNQKGTPNMYFKHTRSVRTQVGIFQDIPNTRRSFG